MDSNRKFQHLLIKVGMVYAVISIGLYFLFSAMLTNHAYDDMSKDEIRHISEMVFESMYTAMLAGSGKEGIEDAARRMNQTGPGMLISVIRGQTVAELFGDNETDNLRRKNDLAIIDVFKNKDEKMFRKDDRIRYLYPATFRDACQQCHTNSSPGQVAAVVEIIYPIQNLKVATDYVNNLMLVYFISTFVVLIGFLSWKYRQD